MSKEIQGLIRITKSQAQPAIETLTKAFKEVDYIKYYFPNDSNREKAIRCFISMGIHAGIKHGEAYASSSDYEGIAIWLPADSPPLTTWKMLSSVPLMSALGFARYGGLKLKRIGDFAEQAHKRLAPFKHWYLQVIGVDPKFQGKGFAGKLIRPVLARTDSLHLPCYLETFEANVPIYERFGFRTIERTSIPQTPFENWAMLREAQ